MIKVEFDYNSLQSYKIQILYIYIFLLLLLLLQGSDRFSERKENIIKSD